MSTNVTMRRPAANSLSLKFSRTLNFLSVFFTTTALLATVWIVVPAPLYSVWLLSIVTSEWSLWFGALGLLGATCSIVARAIGGSGRMWMVSVLCSALAVAFALVPPVSTLRAARDYNIRLSLLQYLSGVWSETNKRHSDLPEFTTHTFAVVDGNTLRLDIYSPPENVSNNGAGIIIVHGGSWNAGQRSDFPQWNRWLVQEGFVVFDIDYRLAPQPNWQMATGDVKHAIAWIKDHAAEFGINPDRLALMGRSAGGHLALLAAYTNGDARLPATEAVAGNRDGAAVTGMVDSSVRAVVSFYAPTDLLWAHEHPANQFVIDGPFVLRRFLGGNPNETDAIRERFRLASPIAHVAAAQTPPTLLIHGGRDQLVRRENMNRLAEQLEGARVPHDTILIPYAQHGFDYNLNGWGAQIVKPIILRFLNEHLDLR